MKDTDEVNGTEQSSSGGQEPIKQEEKTIMVEDKTDAEEKLVDSELKAKEPTDAVQNKAELRIEEKGEVEVSVTNSEAKTDNEVHKIEVSQVEGTTENTSTEEVVEKEEEPSIVESESINVEKVEEPVSPVKENDHQKSELEELIGGDFSKYKKSQFVDLIKILSKHNSPLFAEKTLKTIEPFFGEIKKADLMEAKKVYLKENGSEEGFSIKLDELTNRFDANSRLIHDRKHSFIKDRETQRQNNLKNAEEALEKLRVFVDSEESSASFSKFKEIQNEWKAIGDVPGQHAKNLWANFNALVNRFYDQRSIYFELKELDRKKNYELKVKICERAETLENFENLKDAINSLNDLHEEYKHLGPVPQDLQEALWARFKTASDKVYEKRKEFVSGLKVILVENLAKKEALVEAIKLFVEFESDRIKEWNSKTKELLEIQKNWEAIGGLPRDKSKEINRAFWSSFKTFFHNKSDFFKKLDEERKGNYDAKLVLVEKAETLKDNTDWFKTANDFKVLQQEWKAVGPVPEKVRNEVYEKFKSACDFFFNNKRSSSKDEEKNYKENLKLKKDIITQIVDWTSDANDHIEDFKEKTKEFSAAGFVPRKDINTIKDKFSESVTKFLNGLNLQDEEKNAIRMEVELGDILSSKDSEKILYGKEQNLRRQIQHLENDVSLWKNNLEFFAHSKNADVLRTDVNNKIEKAESKVATLKSQLKILRSV